MIELSCSRNERGGSDCTIVQGDECASLALLCRVTDEATQRLTGICGARDAQLHSDSGAVRVYVCVGCGNAATSVRHTRIDEQPVRVGVSQPWFLTETDERSHGNIARHCKCDTAG